MANLSYFWAKVLRRARGAAIRYSTIDRTSRVHSGSAVIHTRIARHSYCGYDCTLHHCDIGPFCSIASRVSMGGVAHPAHFVSTSPVFLSHKDSVKTKFAHHDYLPALRTEIGADVWIGEGAFVKAGVRVGHGAIIGISRRTTLTIWITLGALATNVLLTLWLVPNFGAAGAVMANAVAYVVFFIGRTEASALVWRQFPRKKLYTSVCLAIFLALFTVSFGPAMPFHYSLIWVIALPIFILSFRNELNEIGALSRNFRK